MTGFYIGLMSGTSLDGIDAVLVEIKAPDQLRQQGWQYTPFPLDLREKLLRFCFAENIPLRTLGELDAELGKMFARSALALLDDACLSPSQIQAIGSHGQTVHHHPYGHNPYSLQIGDPNQIAEHTGITTVADFRRRDIAAGGQGAPLVPAFHQAMFHSPLENRAVLNIGGIANLTLLPADDHLPVTGFDTGPGNTLLNRWISRQTGKPWDERGGWARGGRCIDKLLQSFLTDPYFSSPPPKSTGPEYFGAKWLESHLLLFADQRPQDIQATLTHLTAISISSQIRQLKPQPQKLLVCGGGVHNAFLMELLTDTCRCTVESTAQHGIDPDRVEATAFAWLAYRTMEGQPGNLPGVTGAKRPTILGGVYPG